MKRLLIALFLFAPFGSGLYASHSEQPLPASVIDDAEWLFDEDADDLDNVSEDDCNCSLFENKSEETPSVVQAYYQAVLLQLLSSYLSVKQSYFTFKEYLSEHLSWISVGSDSE